MRAAIRFFVVTALAALVSAGPGAQVSAAQQPPPVNNNYFPKQLPRGQATVISIAIPGGAMPQSAEFSPAAGITVSGIKQAATGLAANGWWEITVAVASDAAPGPRALTLVLPMGRSAPFTFTVANHGLTISALSIVSAQTNQPTVDLQFTAADTASDLGDSPYVWFMLRCGAGEPESGMVRGKMAGGVVRASIPNPRTLKGLNAPAVANRCDLQTRAVDANQIESNTLNTAVEFRN